MTADALALAERARPPEAGGPVRRRRPSLGRLPFLVAPAGTVAVLSWYDVPAFDLVKFTAGTLLAGTLPGMLIWRAVRGGAGYLPLDAAFGTVAGFVIELPVYLIARSRGAVGCARLADCHPGRLRRRAAVVAVLAGERPAAAGGGVVDHRGRDALRDGQGRRRRLPVERADRTAGATPSRRWTGAVRRPLRASRDLARYAVARFRVGEITVYSVRR